ncbi:recombination mediator RecR [Hydrogenivirga sp. 128-5-R1-1]|uniref:recombination mediator RecR n=1 Tax=Hydrogenivirga sp. 128-5-R1-1 TaxID=392423 RepID=UPI00015EF687|nr:recombination mediator RecR [Hydrogenivirga sp. 128-5-R1-1]EDP73838.1 recombination protein RecR [Hydrogenivirga sp. 128-5-R1-1]
MEKQVLPSALQNAIEHISNLPGYGEKSAQRFVENLLKLPKGESIETIKSLLELLEKIHPCKICGLLTENEICSICSSEERNKTTICVVEESFDAFAIEKTGKYTGLYHVLHGKLSPLEGITAEDLNISSLLDRLEGVKEIIIATNPTVEGEATATYIYNLLKNKNVEISRIAYGLPFGATLENADVFTLSKALEGKQKL